MMGTRLTAFALVLLTLPAVARADRHRAQGMQSIPLFSRVKGSTLENLKGEFAWPVPWWPQGALSLVFAGSSSLDTDPAAAEDLSTVVAGPRWTSPAFARIKNRKRALFVTQYLIGKSWKTQEIGTERKTTPGFAWNFTAGFEAPACSDAAVRLQYERISYPVTDSRKGSDALTIGFVIRIKDAPHHKDETHHDPCK
jgi:hypothetical protein